mgnify:CR=1 FL=1
MKMLHPVSVMRSEHIPSSNTRRVRFFINSLSPYRLFQLFARFTFHRQISLLVIVAKRVMFSA